MRATRNARLALILLAAALPFVIFVAVKALKSTSNDPRQWLPRSFDETSKYDRFQEHFGGDEIAVVSWPGCTLDDSRVPQLAEALSDSAFFNGAIPVAIDAIRSAQHPHWFPSLTKEGTPAILRSTGNNHCYLILRGGSDTGPNYTAPHIRRAADLLAAQDLPPAVIVDCSHGNSRKDHEKQAQVIASLCEQITEGETAIRGVMLESHLVAGSQKVVDGVAPTYGQSITDACLSLESTLPLLEQLAAVVRQR